MRKIIIFPTILVLFSAFFSCKKIYTCECSRKVNEIFEVSSTTIETPYKDEAKKFKSECDSSNTTLQKLNKDNSCVIK